MGRTDGGTPRRARSEPDVTQAISSRLAEDADLVDVGANVGLFSIHAALQEFWRGRVLALEPNPRAFALLERNLGYNEVPHRVVAVPFAASRKNATLQLTAVTGRDEYSTLTGSLHPSVFGEQADTFTVRALPLDDLIRQYDLAPGLVKIDAEGAELDVLQGLEQTLANHRPVIVCEIGADTYGTNARTLATLLAEHDYVVRSLDGRRIDLRVPPTDVLACPCEMVGKR
jgi:FkbM family methyltransferase